MEKNDEPKTEVTIEAAEAVEPQTANPITISNATLAGDTVQMSGLTLTGTTDYSTGTGGGGTATDTGGSEPWVWNQLYLDPAGYAGRTVAAGASTWLPIASGKWPVGYKVPDNHTKGGVTPSGTSDGTKPIILQPPPKGVGRLKFYSAFKFLVVNNSSNRGSFSAYIGTYYSNGPSKPMYPYLGVAHDAGSLSAATIEGNGAVLVHVHRLDICDNAFQSDQPIPGWPNWEMLLHTSGTMMYPGLQLSLDNRGSVPLTVKNIFGFGFVC